MGFFTSFGCMLPKCPSCSVLRTLVGTGVGRLLSQATGLRCQRGAACQGRAVLWLTFVLPHIDFQIWSLFGNSSWNVDKRRSRTRSSLWQTTQLLRSTWESLMSFAWKTSFMKLPSRGRISWQSQGSYALSNSQWPVMLPRIEWASSRKWAHQAIEVNASISSSGSWTKPSVPENSALEACVVVLWACHSVSSGKIVFC